MARKGWEHLAPSTRKRYEQSARKRGVDAREAYESGIDLRGHKRHGNLSERQYAKLLDQAHKSELGADQPGGDPAQIIDDALARGMTYQEILARLKVMRQDRDTYRAYTGPKYRTIRGRKISVYDGPGRQHYDARSQHLPIELYYYH